MEWIHPPIQGNNPLKYWKYVMQSNLVQSLATPSKNLNITFLYGENISYWIIRMQFDKVTLSCTKPCISIQKTNVYNYSIKPPYMEGIHPPIQKMRGLLLDNIRSKSAVWLSPLMWVTLSNHICLESAVCSLFRLTDFLVCVCHTRKIPWLTCDVVPEIHLLYIYLNP